MTNKEEIFLRKIEDLLECKLPESLIDCDEMVKRPELLTKIKEEINKELRNYNICCDFTYKNNSLQVLTREEYYKLATAITSLVLLKNGVSSFGWTTLHLVFVLAKATLNTINDELNNLNIKK